MTLHGAPRTASRTWTTSTLTPRPESRPWYSHVLFDCFLTATQQDRLSLALGGSAFLPVAFAGVTHLLSQPNWQARYAALMAISAFGEGCEKQMRDHLTEVMQFVLPYFQDPVSK